MKRHLVLAGFAATLLSSQPCQAENFFKDALRSAAQGIGGQQQVAGSPAGNTNLPPGQYMMTSMYSGQAFYVTVTQQGQMFAADPRTVQVYFQPQGQQPLMNQGYQQQQMMPGQQMPQQGGGFGSMLKNTLMNNLGGGQPEQ